MFVAWLFEYPTLCGGELSLLAVAEHVRAKGVRLTAVAPGTGRLAQRLAELDIPCISFTAQQFADKAKARAALAELLARLQPDLVHANSLAMGRLCGPVLRALGLAGVAHLRDIVRLGGQAVSDLACHRRLLAVSSATRNWHISQGLPAERIHVLYNGVDIQRFAPAAPQGRLREELGLPRQATLIGHVGQLVQRKGTDVLLEAMRLLAGRLPAVHLVICGERYSEKPEAVAYEQRLHAVAASPPLAGRCHFLGYRDDMPEILLEFDVIAHAARQEPLGRVLLEAAASGRPIVATNVGGTPELFPPAAHAALLVPPNDAPALAHALESIVAQPDLARQLGHNARARACQAFSIDSAADGLLQHYLAAAHDQ